MSNSPRLSARLDRERLDALKAYCEEHGLQTADAVRIAIERLLKRKPTGPERERNAMAKGTPSHKRE